MSIVALLVMGLLASTPLRAQDKKVFEVTKIADHLYELSTDGGGFPEKVVASVGTDGVLIVDSGERRTGEALAEALKVFGKGLPRIVINTHSHIEHLGGNPIVGQGAVIVGHRNLRERYLTGLYFFGTFPPEFLPNLTFTDTLTLHFNGEEIRLASFIGAHDDSDIAVWFTGSKVAVVSALCMGTHFPSIDGDTSDVRKYPEVTAKLLAWLPEDVRLVPGHAEDCDMAEARRFLDMLRKTSEIVRTEMAKGKDLAHLVKDDVLAGYASYESSYVKRPEWIEYWYSAYTIPNPGKPRPFAPVIAAFKEKGAVAAVETYAELRRTRPDDYWFEDQALMWMGRRLYRMKRFDDATVFLERCIKEYPGSEGASVSHSVLASVFEQQKDLAKARLHLAAYLEKHAEDAAARKKLSEIDAALKK
jgi:glyoxylase-like metal-dependent hydrolase (beta-lactamase superfamily II)